VQKAAFLPEFRFFESAVYEQAASVTRKIGQLKLDIRDFTFLAST
jgi:hypothetical protein